MVCPNLQCLLEQFAMRKNVVQPKAHLQGTVSPGQPAVRSLCKETAMPSQGPSFLCRFVSGDAQP